MYVIDVIPIVVLPPQSPQILSYFFDRRLPRGALVFIPLGSRKIKAVVVESNTLESQKITLKKSRFQLKKLAKVIIEQPCFSSGQFKLAVWLAQRYVAPLGMCIKMILPPSVTRGVTFSDEHEVTPSGTSALPQHPHIISGAVAMTLPYLTARIEEHLHQGRQVVLIVPEVTTLNFFASTLHHTSPTIVHSGLSKTEQMRVWQDAALPQAKLFIGTRSALMLPFCNLGLVIVEDHEHEAYKSDQSPKYVTPDVAQYVASLQKAEVVFTTPLLSVADWLLKNQGGDVRIFPRHQTSISIVDMAHQTQKYGTPIFSKPLEEAVLTAVHNNTSMLLYSARRGYSTILICRNCGGLARCKNCETPLRVIRVPTNLAITRNESMLVCYHCSAYHPLPDRCGNCSSATLIPSGAPGSQHIEETLRQLLDRHRMTSPDIFIFDSDLIQGRVQEEEYLHHIIQSAAPIVIGTSLILSYRYTQHFPLIAVLNADMLSTSTDFRTDERLALQLAALEDFKPEQFFNQTFAPDNPVFLLFQHGGDVRFYDQEIEARRAFHYPPLGRLALLSYSHANSQQGYQEACVVREQLHLGASRMHATDSVWISNPSHAHVAKNQGRYQYTILLKFDKQFSAFEELLQYIPHGWKIDFDPSSTS